jgi:hypothetical protein
MEPTIEAWLDVVKRGGINEYQIAVRIGETVTHVDLDQAHELVARILLLAKIVDPAGLS